MSRGWHYADVDATRQRAGIAEQSDECPNGVEGCPGPNAGVGELPCLNCLAESDGGDRDVATDGGQTLLEEIDREEIPSTLEVSFPIEEALGGDSLEETSLDEDSIQVLVDMTEDIETSRALREIAEDLVDEDDLPRAKSLLWIDQAEVYSLCHGCYAENSDGAWTGSTTHPDYEKLRKQKLEDLEDGRPCSFCRDERLRDLVSCLEDVVDIEVSVER